MLDVVHISKSFVSNGRTTEALKDVHFSVAEDELLCVVGPSGCGKTTLLKSMAGLMTPSGGQVLFQGDPVLEPPREMAVVFQDYSRSLFPWMTIRKNLLLPLKSSELAKHEKNERIGAALESVGLDGFADHYPWQLSGGMQQRAAIARALAYRPKILIMDEPFASVDAQVRVELEDLVLKLRREYKMTVVFVTHDIDEAVYLGDRVLVLSRRPTVVREMLTIDLGPVRNQVETKEVPRFAELRGQVFRMIRENSQSGDPSAADHLDHAR